MTSAIHFQNGQTRNITPSFLLSAAASAFHSFDDAGEPAFAQDRADPLADLHVARAADEIAGRFVASERIAAAQNFERAQRVELRTECAELVPRPFEPTADAPVQALRQLIEPLLAIAHQVERTVQCAAPGHCVESLSTAAYHLRYGALHPHAQVRQVGENVGPLRYDEFARLAGRER